MIARPVELPSANVPPSAYGAEPEPVLSVDERIERILKQRSGQ
jgi:hypothetical protein